MKIQITFTTAKILFFILFIYNLSPEQSFAQTNNHDIVIGKTIMVESKVLKEKRNIFVSLPVGYEQSMEKYPVIYVLDGGGNFFFSVGVVNFLFRSQRIPRSIVVGIPNTDRTRDFTPVHTDGLATSGGGDKFLEFMGKELLPFIDRNYRTHPYKILFGHSLCGMFSIYTLFEKPDMFNSFIAGSPFLQFKDQYVLDKVEKILSERMEFNNSLFITIGDEPDYTSSLERFTKLLTDKTDNLHWELSERKSENHNSIPLKSLYDGLEFIYSDWILTNETIDNGIVAIKEHYNGLSSKYGFSIKPNEVNINAIGYRYLGNEENEKAIEIFKYNVELYPNSANVYDSLGEAFEKTNNFDAAKENYQMAVIIGEKLKDGNLKIYKKNLSRVIESINN